MSKQYCYKYIFIKYDGKVELPLENKPETTLDDLGAEGWKLIGNEYLGKRYNGNGELVSNSIWIAIKELE